MDTTFRQLAIISVIVIMTTNNFLFLFYDYCQRLGISRHSDELDGRNSILGGGIFYSPQRPDRLWEGYPMGTGGCSPWSKAAEA
jgi:hypothetical protein